MMTDARHDYSQRAARNQQLVKIEHAIIKLLEELPRMVRVTLGEGPHKEYFEHLWQIWANFAKADAVNVKELNQFYQSFVNKQLTALYEEASAKDALIVAQCHIIHQTIDLYYILLNVNLAVSAFKTMPAVDELPELMQVCQQTVTHFEQVFQAFSMDNVHSYRLNLACVLTILYVRMWHTATYSLNKVLLAEDEENALEVGCVHELNQILQTSLPSLDDINTSIQALHAASEGSAEKAQQQQKISHYRSQISLIVKALAKTESYTQAAEKCVHNLNDDYDKFIKQYGSADKPLAYTRSFSMVEGLISQLEHMNATQKAISSLGVKLAEACDQQAYLPSALYLGVWGGLASYFRQLTTDLSKLLSTITEPYVNEQKDLLDARDMLAKITAPIDNMRHETTLLVTKIAQARYFLRGAIALMQDTDNELQAHLAGSGTLKYWRSFLSHHWPKMLTFSTGGVGSGVGFMFLLGMTQPVGAAVLVTSNFLLGSALGIGTGLLVDSFTTNDKSKSEEPLLEDKTIQLSINEPNLEAASSNSNSERRSGLTGWWSRWQAAPEVDESENEQKRDTQSLGEKSKLL